MILQSMESQIDCGRISAANVASLATGKLAHDLYQQTAKFRQPSWWPACDFWDSPSRQIQMIEDLTGQKAGLLPLPALVTSAVLLKIGLTTYHWITMISPYPNLAWHDGRDIWTVPIEARFPGSSVVMAIAPGAVIPLPTKWRFWGAITGPLKSIW